ncbi:uncharacterized protein LOC127806978 isoform X3 [Diospyros lotus]|uniref:uncharacterized protein LOC127806978 isoform X3 n=1 Tax=Diospyros lotus TaxID=55363 RepID=UPI002255A4DB|nr:uncharacterized protein LOC127806978 isoform X3 [Diospyros lotus]
MFVYASHGNPPSSTNAKPSQEENTAIIRIVWPQTNIPTFKIISSDCLQKVRIGEQISLVRMKVPWPLSAREVVVHFFEFEYFQDDLIVVLLNSISDLESIDRSTHGFSKDGIPDAQDVVRIDVVGGFALQKVTADRSYFRTIANFDMKLDFVPPSFINFVSRQLIGSGFRLYKKEVASVSRGDEDFGKALKDQLYNRIREILYSDNKQKRALELGDTKNDVETFHEEHVLEVLSDHHATETFPEDAVVEYDHHATGTFSEDAVVEDHIAIIEIEEIAEEDIEQSGHLEEGGKQISNRTTTQIEEKPCVNNKIIGVSPQVKQALETLDKVISICREYRLGPQTRSPEFTHKGSFDVGKNREKELRSLGNGQICASDQACVDALKNETVERALHEPRNSSSSHCSRRMGSNSCSRETCHNKIAPASPEENLLHASETHQQTASYYSTHATTERTIVGGTGFDDKLANVDANAICKDGTKTGKHKKPKFCCFHCFLGH